MTTLSVDTVDDLLDQLEKAKQALKECKPTLENEIFWTSSSIRVQNAKLSHMQDTLSRLNKELEGYDERTGE